MTKTMLTALLLLASTTATPADRSLRAGTAERLHANALESFRQGRFSEAYGRFIALASGGHAASARYALWMCEHGPALFDKDWDCSQDDVDDWAGAAGVNAPRVLPRHYPQPTGGLARTSRR